MAVWQRVHRILIHHYTLVMAVESSWCNALEMCYLALCYFPVSFRLLANVHAATRPSSHQATLLSCWVTIKCTEMYLHLTTTVDEWKFPASSSSYHNAPTPRPSNTMRNSVLARQWWSSPTYCEFLFFLDPLSLFWKNRLMSSGAGIAQSV
jgi:hypothetical protein